MEGTLEFLSHVQTHRLPGNIAPLLLGNALRSQVRRRDATTVADAAHSRNLQLAMKALACGQVAEPCWPISLLCAVASRLTAACLQTPNTGLS